MVKKKRQPELTELARHLRTILTTEELDRSAETDGGISMNNERFAVYCDEYARRGISMPQ